MALSQHTLAAIQPPLDRDGSAAQKTLMNRPPVADQLLLTKAIGDGDCMYHATAANIVYHVLDGNFGDEAHPSNAHLRQNLLPHLIQLAHNKGINLNAQESLQNSFVTLMRAYAFDSKATRADESITETIRHCNFAALSKQILVPAINAMVFAQSQNDAVKPGTQAVLNDVLHDDFVAFAYHIYRAKQANLLISDDALCRSFSSGEFANFPADKKPALLADWLTRLENNNRHPVSRDPRAGAAARQARLGDTPKDRKEHDRLQHQEIEPFLAKVKPLYNAFVTSRAANTFYADYCEAHKAQGVFRGVVQQAVIEQALHATFVIVDQQSHNLSLSLQKYQPVGGPTLADDSTMLFIRHGAGHFESRIGKPEAPLSEIATAFSEQFSATHADENSGAYRTQQPYSVFQSNQGDYLSDEAFSTLDLDSLSRDSVLPDTAKEVTYADIDVSDEAIQQATQAIATKLPQEKVDQATSDAYSRDILKAALNSYGFFGTQSSALPDELKSDHRLAIQLQNEEIEAFLSKKLCNYSPHC
jgi:hypothetical protein